MVHIEKASTENDLKGILRLQKLNLGRVLSYEEQISQGFVTVEHDLVTLRRLNERTQHAIAKHENHVVGYALGMAKVFQNEIPVLAPMFERINRLQHHGEDLSDIDYLIMGQVCISKDFRGKGIYKSLFDLLRQEHSRQFRYLITEVAKRNIRSLRAHENVGFILLEEYKDQEAWVILIWEWNKNYED